MASVSMPGPQPPALRPPMDDPAGPEQLHASRRDPGRDRRSRWVAILTGALSILIGGLYLLMVTVLDRSGPLLPPPPEAFAEAVPAAAGRSLPGSGAPSAPPLEDEVARIAHPDGAADAGPAV
jgi:hypothetical protein